MDANELKLYLQDLFTDDYKAKFDRVIGQNEFSVSTLVDGPGVALKYRAASYDPGLKRKFNAYFFRGSAIHEFINAKIADDNWLLRQELSMNLYADNGDDLKVYGHPDAINSVKPIVLEFKTLDSEDPNYRKRVIRKAYRQVGTYAKMCTDYNEEAYEAFVVVLDFMKKTPLTEKEMEAGAALRNGIGEEMQLTEMDLEYGATLNDPLLAFKLTDDEISHGYNYVRWCAREAWKRMCDPDSLMGAGVI